MRCSPATKGRTVSFSRTWIPNQHGAWAMLITPVVVGALAAGPLLVHVTLLVTWLAAYCMNYFIGLIVKSRRQAKYRTQVLTYGAVTAVFGLPLAWSAPRLLWLLPVALPVFLANLGFIRQRNERSWVNDVLGVLLAGVVGMAAYAAGFGRGPIDPAAAQRTALALVLVTAYFAGTVFYVKTMIRERGQRLWLWLSYGWHVGFIGLALALGSPLGAGIGGWLLARSILMPRRGGTPKLVGLLEIPATIAVGLAALLTVA